MNQIIRKSTQVRVTGETDISVVVELDGKGEYEIDTGNGMFDHLIAQLSRHGLIDLKIKATGDTHVGWHHLVEDTAIVLGRAFKEAVETGLVLIEWVIPMFRLMRPWSFR